MPNLKKYYYKPLVFISLVFALTMNIGCDSKKEKPFEFIISEEMAIANNHGVALMGQFNYSKAMQIFEQLEQKYPEWQEVKINQIIARLNRNLEGDTQTALQHVSSILLKDPDNLRGHYIKGILSHNDGNIAQAREEFKWVLQHDKDNGYAAYFMAQGYFQQQQYEKALQWYQKAAGFSPYLRSIYYGAFQTAQKLRKKELARSYLKDFQTLKNNPRAQMVEIKYTRMGELAEVITIDATESKANNYEGELFLDPISFQLAVSQDKPVDDVKASLSTADYNLDGIQDLLLHFNNNPYLVAGNPKNDMTMIKQHPLLAIDKINAFLWGDYNNDGLSDLYLLRDGKNQLWKNMGKGLFVQALIPGVSEGENNSVDGVFFDADHDGDLDIYVINSNAKNSLLNNNLDETFRVLGEDYNLSGEAVESAAVMTFDFDQDRDTDVLILNKHSAHRAYSNNRLWNYQQASSFSEFVKADIISAVVADIDANGRPEIYTQGSNAVISRWEKKDNVWLQSAVKFDKKPQLSEHPKLGIYDISGNGILDLIVSDATGFSVYGFDSRKSSFKQLYHAKSSQPIIDWLPVIYSSDQGYSMVAINAAQELVIWSPGAGRHKFASLSFSGLENNAESMRSNASGIGTTIAARNGSLWTITNTFRQISGKGQSIQPTAIGLGETGRLDFISIDWSDGVFQTEMNLKSGHHTITETQRQLASCPVLFAWNGKTYQFVSDILGVGGIGFAVGPGEYAEPRPWENFLLPEKLLQSHKGFYQLVISEPMEEVMYFDTAELVVYDTPPGIKLSIDERMGVSAPFPSGKTFAYKTSQIPVKAQNQHGKDILATISKADHIAAPVGELDHRFIGMLKQQHQITFSFKEAVDVNKQAVLLIDGWVEYPYSQTSFAAWQANRSYQAATLEAKDSNGKWQIVHKDFGYPAGMPRQMSLPLQNLPESASEFRLSTNMEIYWDKIALTYAQELASSGGVSKVEGIEQHLLKIAKADVLPVGFAKRTTGAQRLPHYDFTNSAPLWDTRHLTGYYSRFGDVYELVSKKDDALAIIGPGEGLRLLFPEIKTPLKKGWKRSYVLQAKGWVKDMDLYTLNGETIEPLPGTDNPKRQALHAKYNTRYH